MGRYRPCDAVVGSSNPYARMMTIGPMTGSGMVFHMGGMMGGSVAGMMGTGPGMVFGIVWMALVASALIQLQAAGRPRQGRVTKQWRKMTRQN